jgi:hypothetical protein
MTIKGSVKSYLRSQQAECDELENEKLYTFQINFDKIF